MNSSMNKRLKPRWMQKADLIWEVPLALFSYGFFKLVKKFITVLYVTQLKKSQGDEQSWVALDENMMAKPLSVPVLLVNAPRWNTHALIAKTGGISVANTLTVDIATAAKSAFPWTIVLYRYPDFSTVTQINGFETLESQQWRIDEGRASIQLEKGVYALGLRYYNSQLGATLPEVQADGTRAIPAQKIQGQANTFYQTLANKQKGIYFLFHYYAYVILQLRRWLPEKFVLTEYLPVGNPDTYFYFGSLLAGDKFKVAMESAVMSNYDVYFSVYDRASFPIAWGRLAEPQYTSAPVSTKSTYLIRVCKTVPGAPFSLNMLQVGIC